MKILYVVDNPADAELARMAISEHPEIETDTASGLAGFQRVFSPAVHKAVLSGHQLIDGHGTDILRILRESGHSTPCIIVSGVIDEKLATELLTLGATDYVFKDNLEKLPLVLTRALRESHMREQIRLLGLSMHDMMSPVTAVSGYSELLDYQISDVVESGQLRLDVQQSEKMIRYTDIIKNGISDISAILDQLRSISRQKLDLESDFLPVDTNTVWVTREVCELMRGSAFRRNHELTFIEPDEPVFACIDMGYYKRILYNFISNAIRYSPANSKITVRVYVVGNEAVVSVSDEGIGVSDEYHTRIFQLYGTINPSDLEQRNSTGLGLYINTILAQKLGGRITLESTLGKGSTFYLILPASTYHYAR